MFLTRCVVSSRFSFSYLARSWRMKFVWDINNTLV
jgi:hypothetical protein